MPLQLPMYQLHKVPIIGIEKLQRKRETEISILRGHNGKSFLRKFAELFLQTEQSDLVQTSEGHFLSFT
jgi:hypothetical protein